MAVSLPTSRSFSFWGQRVHPCFAPRSGSALRRGLAIRLICLRFAHAVRPPDGCSSLTWPRSQWTIRSIAIGALFGTSQNWFLRCCTRLESTRAGCGRFVRPASRRTPDGRGLAQPADVIAAWRRPHFWLNMAICALLAYRDRTVRLSQLSHTQGAKAPPTEGLHECRP
jgi:hypothetical protein